MSENFSDDIKLIIEHLEEIESFFEEITEPDDFIKTKQGKAYYNAIIMHLQAGSEVLKKLYQQNEARFELHTEIPWREIIRMRDLISHHYDKLQHEVVFDICKTSIPSLLNTLKIMLSETQH